MAAISFRMPFGVQGDVVAPSLATIEAQAYNSALPFAQYGIAGKAASGKFVPVAAQNDVVYGFLCRPFPITGANASDPLGTSAPSTLNMADVLRRGYITVSVQLGAASAAMASNVYLRYQNPSGSQIVGGVEGASTGNTYQLTSTYSYGSGAYFMTPADGNGLALVSWNI